MSRHLPARPSLEHLKKQAKDLLPALKKRDPATRLADAQHAIAREYGFASWPKLRAHLEAQVAARDVRDSPLVGCWKVHLSRSRGHPAHDFQDARVEFAIAGDDVRITDVVVDANGREECRVNTIRADGRGHEVGNGYTLCAVWRDERVLETIAKKNGQVVGWGRYEVSADGKTLTVSADEMRIVFERAEGA